MRAHEGRRRSSPPPWPCPWPCPAARHDETCCVGAGQPRRGPPFERQHLQYPRAAPPARASSRRQPRTGRAGWGSRHYCSWPHLGGLQLLCTAPVGVNCLLLRSHAVQCLPSSPMHAGRARRSSCGLKGRPGTSPCKTAHCDFTCLGVVRQHEMADASSNCGAASQAGCTLLAAAPSPPQPAAGASRSRHTILLVAVLPAASNRAGWSRSTSCREVCAGGTVDGRLAQVRHVPFAC